MCSEAVNREIFEESIMAGIKKKFKLILIDIQSMNFMAKELESPSDFVADLATCISAIYSNLCAVDYNYAETLFKSCLLELSQMIFEVIFQECEVTEFTGYFVEQLAIDLASMNEVGCFEENVVEWITAGLRELRTFFRIFINCDFNYYRDGKYPYNAYTMVSFINKYAVVKGSHYPNGSDITELVKE